MKRISIAAHRPDSCCTSTPLAFCSIISVLPIFLSWLQRYFLHLHKGQNFLTTIESESIATSIDSRVTVSLQQSLQHTSICVYYIFIIYNPFECSSIQNKFYKGNILCSKLVLIRFNSSIILFVTVSCISTYLFILKKVWLYIVQIERALRGSAFRIIVNNIFW